MLERNIFGDDRSDSRIDFMVNFIHGVLLQFEDDVLRLFEFDSHMTLVGIVHLD